MDTLFRLDWRRILLPSISFAELFVRGSLVYLVIFALMRFILKREAGELGITDLLVVVLIADAAQNAMADEYRSVSDGIFLVATIISWSYELDWLGYRFPRLQRLIRPPPLLLVKDGNPVQRNLRRELITMDELLSLLREEGVEDMAHVKRAYMESDGRISVITYEEHAHRARKRRVE